MAQRHKSVVGLDIGPAGITAAELASDDHPGIQRTAFVPLEPGVFRDGEIADVEALTAALKDLYAANKGLDRRVSISLANQKLVVRTIDLPPIEDADELNAAVRFQAQDEIPMPLDQAIVDWQPQGLVETEQGMRQRVQIVAARRDMVDRFVTAARGAGLRLERLDLGAFALVRALGAGAAADEAVLYADVGGITNLAVAMGGQCLFTRASSVGVESLAIDLAERRQLTLEHARGWLQHVGLERPVELIDGDGEIVGDARRILEDGVRRIASEVRQSVDFHQLQHGAANVSRAVITGSAIAIPGFAEAVGLELGLAASAGTVPGEPEGSTAGALTVAAGIAMSGTPSANLLPEDLRRAAGAGGRSGGAVYAFLGVLAVLFVLAAGSVVASNSVSSKQSELNQVTAQAVAAEQAATQLSAYTDFASLRQKRVETVTSLAKSRLDWGYVLGEVARTLPSNVWLISLDGNVSGVAAGVGGASAATGSGSPTLDIVGCTTSMGNVARMMAAMRRINGVQAVSLSSSTKADTENSSGDGSGSTGGSTGTGSGDGKASTSDCRNGSDSHPKFEMKLTLTAPSATATAGGVTATTATVTTTSGGGAQ